MLTSEKYIFRIYRGLGPLLMKQLPYTIVQLTSFNLLIDQAYHFLNRRYQMKKSDLNTTQQLSVSLMCGVFAGMLSSIASHPAGKRTLVFFFLWEKKTLTH